MLWSHAIRVLVDALRERSRDSEVGSLEGRPAALLLWVADLQRDADPLVALLARAAWAASGVPGRGTPSHGWGDLLALSEGVWGDDPRDTLELRIRTRRGYLPGGTLSSEGLAAPLLVDGRLRPVGPAPEDPDPEVERVRRFVSRRHEMRAYGVESLVLDTEAGFAMCTPPPR